MASSLRRVRCDAAELLAAERAGSRRPPHERPASRVGHAEQRDAAATARASARASPIRRHEQRAQAAEAVGVDEAQRHELGERLFDLRGQHARALDDLIEERSAVRLDDFDDVRAPWR